MTRQWLFAVLAVLCGMGAIVCGGVAEIGHLLHMPLLDRGGYFVGVGFVLGCIASARQT